MRTDTERHERFLEELEAHQGLLRKVAALYARDASDRDDLMQEIALQLWRAFGSFRGESAFSTFMYRVALNTALMRRRGASRRPDLTAGRDVEKLPSPATTRDDEEVERLYAAIRQLPPVDRAIVLMLLDERSRDEIAAVTGLAKGTVAVRLLRAKKKLRRLLDAGQPTGKGAPCSTKT
jgi:RNA polymerase sigma-70 factor (ECF subfamily)